MSESPTPLRFPTPSRPASDAESRQALAELSRHFRRQLDESAASWEGVSYDLLERAADGVLSAEERHELDLAIAADPSLQGELDDLLALRARLTPSAPDTPLRSRPARRISQLAGIAAALLITVIGADWALDRSGSGKDSSVYARKTARPPVAAPSPETTTTTPPEPLFRDGFESGDASSWAN